ncbi:MAG: biotin transporter BioY [Clostridia bacterium]|nr:biotin transporter BioY [Clostridia bacterium]
MNEPKKKLSTKMLCLCGLFTALITVGAFIRIPLPVIPFTLQTLFILLAGLLLGKNYASLSCLAYLVLGLIGLPIFTQGGGIGYVLQPTFGYIIGFVLGAWVIGKIAVTSSYSRLLAASFAGLGVIYLFGAVYYYLLATLYLQQSVAIGALLVSCVLTTLPVDCVLALIAASLAKRLKRHI